MADSTITPLSFESASHDPGLTPEEDNELRQLTWFSLVGQLSDPSQARMLELRAKDRRSRVRNPRPDPSVSRMGTPDAPASTPRLNSDHEAAAGNFICPNCGFVQRGPGLS
jgi:hypothetical protein